MIDRNWANNKKLNVEDHRLQVTHLSKMKTNFAAWIVSDCTNTKEAKTRMQIVSQLENAGM